jgi:hypothetical protein
LTALVLFLSPSVGSAQSGDTAATDGRIIEQAAFELPTPRTC